MDLEMAKQLLSTCIKHELRDHAFGDCEVSWYDGSNHIAVGYFSGGVREVSVDGVGYFTGDEADELRQCFASEQVERNDETGPDEFEIGKVMPGLSIEDVRKELTGDDIPAHLRIDAPVAKCNRCGRESVAKEEFGKEDRMTQPDGNPCGGRFSDPSKELTGE